MTDKSTIATRLRELMNVAKVGENELARQANVPQPTIHRILTGDSKSPRIANLEKIAKALGTTTSYLAHGDSTPVQLTRGAAISAAGSLLGPIGTATLSPIGFAVDAFDLARRKNGSRAYTYPILQLRDSITMNEIKKNISRPENNYELSSYKANGLAFWLELKGDAMSSPPGVTPSLPAGTRVLFDTNLASELGKLVLAQLPNTSEPIFRKLIEDSGKKYLQSLNPSYPLICLEADSLILAVAVEAKTLL